MVGAGPAGLATALAARRQGLSVTVVDRRPEPPVDKACGEGLMPDGVEALTRLGVSPDALPGAPFVGIRYVDGDVVAEGEFPGGPGRGVRRTRLHAALVEAAEAAGVEIRWGTRVTGLDHRPGPLGGTFTALARLPAGGSAEDAGEVVPPPTPGPSPTPGAESARHRAPGAAAEAEVSAAPDGGPSPETSAPLPSRWVVAADGLLSPLRREAGLEGPAARRRRFGVRRHFAVGADHVPDRVEVWWGDGCEAYVTPVGDDEVGVAILWGGRKADFDELLAGFPRLARRLEGCPESSRDRGAGPLRQRVRGVVRGNLALVGDASGYVDAITGEGMSLAFQQAEALAAALAAGRPDRYAAAHRRLACLPDALTHLLLFVERHPVLRRRTVRALAADPALFSRILGLHARQLPPSAFGWTGAARLAFRLVTA